MKRRINVGKNRELRGGGMYAVATLFCLPLPLSFLAGVVVGASATSAGRPVYNRTLLIAGLVLVWVPVLVAFVLAFALAKPKPPPRQQGPTVPRGFEVMQ